MKETTYSYQGVVEIHLQGKEAVEFIEDHDTYVVFVVGALESNIKIIDYRPATIKAARNAVALQNPNVFAEHFNQPAKIWIESSKDQTLIELRECKMNQTNPKMFWVGSLKDEPFPDYPLIWGQFRNVETNRLAFATLID